MNPIYPSSDGITLANTLKFYPSSDGIKWLKPGGEIMANSDPVQTEKFKAQQFTRSDGHQPLHPKPIQLKVDEDVWQALQTVSDRAAYMRQALRDRLIADGLL